MEESNFGVVDRVNCMVEPMDELVVEHENDQTVWFTINGDQSVNISSERAKELAQNILNFFSKAEV